MAQKRIVFSVATIDLVVFISNTIYMLFTKYKFGAQTHAALNWKYGQWVWSYQIEMAGPELTLLEL